MAMSKQRALAMRKALKDQKRGMGGGLIIDNKNFTKMNMRLIPVPETEELPGHEYWSLFSKRIGKKGNGTTSPRTFGLPCPVMDFLDKIHHEGDKEDKENAKGKVQVARDYWLGVWDCDDRGAPGNKSIRIHRAKRTVYEQLIGYMLDTDEEDTLDDITDPIDGRDIRVRKEGRELDTKWTVKFMDPAPIVDDEDELKAYVEEASGFDPRKYFYKVDLAILNQMYEMLTGEDIPDSYLEEIGKVCKSDDDDKKKEEGNEGEEENEDAGTEAESEEETTEDEGGQEEETEGESEEVEIEYGETRGQFDNGGETVEGIILELTTDEDGKDVYAVREDGDDEAWHVPCEDVTVVVPEPEPEPEPVAPTKSKKSAPKKPAAKKPAEKKKTTTAKPKGKGTTAKPKSGAVSKLRNKLRGAKK